MPVVEIGELFAGSCPPDVRGAVAGVRQACVAQGSPLPRADPASNGRELRLREFGTKQRAWAKLLRDGEVETDEMVATLGPEAWPAPALEALASAVDEPRHLHPLLRDQRVIAGIGRTWVDEILWEAGLSPFKKGSDLEPDEESTACTRRSRCSGRRSTTTRT